jgi:hypothetical protein
MIFPPSLIWQDSFARLRHEANQTEGNEVVFEWPVPLRPYGLKDQVSTSLLPKNPSFSLLSFVKNLLANVAEVLFVTLPRR